MKVREDIQQFISTIPSNITLVAATKYVDSNEMRSLFKNGVTNFGENRVDAFLSKYEDLKDLDVTWHFIGHLQTNKVKYIAPYVSMIEAVDSLKLLKEINRQAEKCGRCIKVLLELHIAEESTKYGLTLSACRELLESDEWREMKHVQICGLMMMASFVDDKEQIRSEMQTAADFFDEVKTKYFVNDDAFCERSWGMSDDYLIAVETGSTMVRIGTTIFGPRVY